MREPGRKARISLARHSDRGQWKTRDMKDRGWVVCGWLPSLSEAVDGGVYRELTQSHPLDGNRSFCLI